MNEQRLRRAGLVATSARAAAERAYRKALNAAIDELERDGAHGNTTRAAELIGVTRATIYNELARRQDRADALSNGHHPPAPAPADADG